MSDIYLQITETPTVVTLSAPVVSGALASTVTVANTVTVALDSNSLSALENVTVTVGAAITGTVTVSNFPASQAVTFSAVSISNFPATQPVSIASVTIGNTVTIAGTVTANPTGTQTIAGTVTANLGLYPTYANGVESLTIDLTAVRGQDSAPWLRDGGGNVPISGTVTIGAGTAQIGSVTASISGTVPISISSVTVGNSVTIGSLPAISGTVTANTFALQGTAVTTSNFTSTTASTVLANYNATREVLTIFNEGAGNLHVCVGATCTTIAYQVRLSAGDYYEVPNHQTTITHSAVFATAGTARVTEVS